jgi:hypothetical protein
LLAPRANRRSGGRRPRNGPPNEPSAGRDRVRSPLGSPGEPFDGQSGRRSPVGSFNEPTAGRARFERCPFDRTPVRPQDSRCQSAARAHGRATRKTAPVRQLRIRAASAQTPAVTSAINAAQAVQHATVRERREIEQPPCFHVQPLRPLPDAPVPCVASGGASCIPTSPIAGRTAAPASSTSTRSPGRPAARSAGTSSGHTDRAAPAIRARRSRSARRRSRIRSSWFP